MRARTAALASAASGIALGLSAASAQSTAAQSTSATTAPDDEIVVSARKTEENLRDVPVAANVLGEGALDELVLDKIEDYLRQSPSTILVAGGPEYLSDISIRGQGGGRQGFSESASGIYRNGIFVAGGGFGGRTFNTLDLFDAARVEVLRGPQGALLGRNAVGGAVNVVTNRPDLDNFEATIGVGYDDRRRITYNGVLNVPLADDRLGVRLAVTGYDQNDGFYIDVNTGENVDDQDFLGGRGSLTWALSDDWRITVTGERSTTSAPSFSALGRRLDVPGRAERFDPSEFERNASRLGVVEIDETTGFVEIDGNVGFADLAVAGVYRSRNGGRANDDLDHFLGFEGVGGTDLAVAQAEDFERLGVEVRLSSMDWESSNIRWLIGADYQDSSSDISTINTGVTAVAALREVATRTDLTFEEVDSWSIFGLAEWDITERLTVSFEGRYLEDDRDFLFERIDAVPAPVNSSLGPATDAISSTGFKPTGTIRYRLDDRNIVYARVATAFRPGGFNTGTINVDFLSYEKESVLGGEVGWKGRPFSWLDAALTAYVADIKDLQVVTAISTTDTTTALVNVPGSFTYGFEAEFTARFEVGPGILSFQGSAAHVDGEFDDNSVIVVQGTPFDISGTRTNRTRDLTAVLNTRYAFPLTSSVNAFALATVRTENGGYENAIGALKVPGQSRSLDDYTIVDFRLGADIGPVRASFFMQNAGNQTVFLQNVLQNEYFGSRRIIGGEVRVNFGG
jgi:outer membrane receptor protein involved in Fe transport